MQYRFAALIWLFACARGLFFEQPAGSPAFAPQGFVRLTPPAPEGTYDGFPGARAVSNAMNPLVGGTSETAVRLHPQGLSMFAVAFAQFDDHDRILTSADTLTHTTIPTPEDDHFFQGAPIAFTALGPTLRNRVTAELDLSATYGTDLETFWQLVSERTGLMRTSRAAGREQLPLQSTLSLPHAMENPGLRAGLDPLASGDVRANETPGLLSMHNFFLLSHNRIARTLLHSEPDPRRKAVRAALYNVALYRRMCEDLLDHLVDVPTRAKAIELARRTNSTLISLEWSMANRFGHSLVSPIVKRDRGPDTPLQGEFFAAQPANPATGVAPLEDLLAGYAQQAAHAIDTTVTSVLRNLLMVTDTMEHRMDLLATNIMRGRERGFLPFHAMRQALGLPRLAWADEGELDLLHGCLRESALRDDGYMGETLGLLVYEQFARSSAQDPQWYEEPYRSWARGLDLEAYVKKVVPQMAALSFPDGDVFRTAARSTTVVVENESHRTAIIILSVALGAVVLVLFAAIFSALERQDGYRRVRAERPRQ